jgi:alkylhydroperoxidase family enzyme
MARLDVPESAPDPLLHLWSLVPRFSGPAAAFSDAVYKQRTLSLGEFEAARISVARINDCAICLTIRPDDGPTQDFYDAVLGGGGDLTEREALAAEFARRFAADHLGMDDELWSRLHAVFSDAELVELGLAVGSWLAFGRLNRVFEVDGMCRVDLNPHGSPQPR